MDWNNPLLCDLLSRFEKWQKELYLIKDIKVPRLYGFNELKGDTVELHIFTDSSQLAYGTCAYFHIIQDKVLTIPKLKLQTAVIASRMKCQIVDESQIIVNIYF